LCTSMVCSWMVGLTRSLQTLVTSHLPLNPCKSFETHCLMELVAGGGSQGKRRTFTGRITKPESNLARSNLRLDRPDPTQARNERSQGQSQQMLSIVMTRMKTKGPLIAMVLHHKKSVEQTPLQWPILKKMTKTVQS
jgi:hypothetical protein